MSSRRRPSAGSPTEGGFPMFTPNGREEDKGHEDIPPHDDDSELGDPEYFESLVANSPAVQNRGEDTQALDAKSGRGRWFRIYVLHLLFMWNLRTYEYASVS